MTARHWTVGAVLRTLISLRRFFFPAFLLIFLVFARQVESGALPEAFVVRKATFSGVNSVSKKELRKTLAARPRPFWRFWEPKTALSEIDLKDDLERIRQFYRARGYYHARVEMDAERTGQEAATTAGEHPGPLPAVRVAFSVREGPPVIVSEIQIDQPLGGLLDEEVRKRIALQKGKVFTTSDYRSAKKTIERLYGNRGFPFVQVDGQARVDVRENLARVSLVVKPGGIYRFGEVTIAQDGEIVKETIIRRALEFEPGEKYRASAVEQSQRNLVNLDVFRSALIVSGRPEEESDKLPMEVRLRAKEPRQIGFGVGYGSEDGLRLKASWSYRNMLSRAGKFTLSARRTDLIENAQAEYFQPYWLDARNDLRGRTGWEREDLESYTNETTFANIAVDRRLSRLWTGSAGYKLENNRLQKIKILDPLEIEELVKNNNYLVSAVNFSLTRSTVDDLLYPAEGSTVTLAFEQASDLFGSELTYWRPAAEVRAYRTFFPPVTLAGRIRLETIQETEDTDFIPIPERLFLGGSNTVRGYGYQMVGPVDPAGNPLGGKSAANANLEARFPIYRSFSGVVFLDAGLVDPEAFKFDLSEVRTACGAGFRYDTPIGPLRVEVGYKLNPVEEDELPAGVEAEERWRIHFSIGQTF
ncbi:MAG: BamA/TamA family outer membrane protein [Desulfobacterales bacterium]|nr:BamA/TamA family outer membrane protein [Desulfobacterales bacterium]MCF8080243.1 BamA/TamA family outer membrane protein [Desulfobacterales bacterium]